MVVTGILIPRMVGLPLHNSGSTVILSVKYSMHKYTDILGNWCQILPGWVGITETLSMLKGNRFQSIKGFVCSVKKQPKE